MGSWSAGTVVAGGGGNVVLQLQQQQLNQQHSYAKRQQLRTSVIKSKFVGT